MLRSADDIEEELPSSGPASIVDLDPGKVPAFFLEVTDLDERGPEFDRTLDGVHHVVHDAQQVLLKKVWLGPIKGLQKIGREQSQGFPAFRSRRSFGPGQRPAVHGGHFVENEGSVFRRDFALVIEGHVQLVHPGDRGLDFPFQKVRHFFVEDLGRDRVPHVVGTRVIQFSSLLQHLSGAASFVPDRRIRRKIRGGELLEAESKMKAELAFAHSARLGEETRTILSL